MFVRNGMVWLTHNWGFPGGKAVRSARSRAVRQWLNQPVRKARPLRTFSYGNRVRPHARSFFARFRMTGRGASTSADSSRASCSAAEASIST